MSKELQFKGIKGHSEECNSIMNKLFLVKESNGVQFHLLEEEIHDILFKMNEDYCNLLDWLDDIARREYEEQFNEEEVITIPCSEYDELNNYKAQLLRVKSKLNSEIGCMQKLALLHDSVILTSEEYEKLQKYKKYYETDRFDDGK